MHRKITALLATGVLAVGVGVSTAAQSTASTPSYCTARVIPFEDGTWSGGRVKVKGNVYAETWRVAPGKSRLERPKGVGELQLVTQFPPAVNGKRCVTYLLNR